MNTLSFAIKMEADGEKYYTAQAKINENNSLQTVCLMLAADEKRHGEILQKKLAGQVYALPDSPILETAKNVFSNIGQFKSQIKAIPSQLDFYRMALDQERRSIDLYYQFLYDAADDQDKQLFTYLIEQEENHFTTLEELVTLLDHAEEWVEFAEFGLRKDY